MNKNNFPLLIFAFIMGIVSLILYDIEVHQKSKRDLAPIDKIFAPKPPAEPKLLPPPPLPSKIEPEFVKELPLRSVTNLGKVLSDIDSHMPAGHIYRDNDKITWGHETTHGINSRLRMKFSRRFYNGKEYGVWIDNKWKSFARINCFYVLENNAIVIKEPDTTIQVAAKLVPQSLRGGVYNLYMVQQAGSWGDTPLYVWDEWVAYTNGSEVRLDLGITSRAETVQFMLEFNVYAISVAQACKSNDPQFKDFLMWHLERTMKLYKDSLNLGDLSKSTAYLEKVKTSNDAENFRSFCKEYFGTDWTKRVLLF